MDLLLDTHAFLWFAQDSPRLSPKARESIENDTHTIYVSAVSAYEISFKATLGKLRFDSHAHNLSAVVTSFAFVELPITITHAQGAGKLDPTHRDPFDRLLAAQCMAGRLRLVTSDSIFERLGVETLW